MLSALLALFLAAQPAPPAAPGPDAIAGMSEDGRVVLRQAMSEWAPIAAAEREAALATEREIEAIAGERPVDLQRLGAALEARDEAEAAWRRRRTEWGLAMIERLPEADRAIVVGLLPGIVAPAR